MYLEQNLISYFEEKIQLARLLIAFNASMGNRVNLEALIKGLADFDNADGVANKAWCYFNLCYITDVICDELNALIDVDDKGVRQ